MGTSDNIRDPSSSGIFTGAEGLQVLKVSLAVLALPTSYVQHQVGTAGEKRGEKTCALQHPASTSRVTVWPQ